MDEYIKREEIRRAYEKLTRSYVNGNPYIADWRFDEMIEKLPAADVAQIVHARWIGAPLCGNDNCRCSNCGSWHNIHANLRGKITQKYCPSCGAKMDGGAD